MIAILNADNWQTAVKPICSVRLKIRGWLFLSCHQHHRTNSPYGLIFLISKIENVSRCFISIHKHNDKSKIRNKSLIVGGSGGSMRSRGGGSVISPSVFIIHRGRIASNKDEGTHSWLMNSHSKLSVYNFRKLFNFIGHSSRMKNPKHKQMYHQHHLLWTARQRSNVIFLHFFQQAIHYWDSAITNNINNEWMS